MRFRDGKRGVVLARQGNALRYWDCVQFVNQVLCCSRLIFHLSPVFKFPRSNSIDRYRAKDNIASAT